MNKTELFESIYNSVNTTSKLEESDDSFLLDLADEFFDKEETVMENAFGEMRNE